MGSGASIRVLLVAVLFGAPASASAEWQIKPFLGVTFHGDSTFANGQGASHPSLTLGVSGLLLGEVVGVEAEVAHVPGFFQGDPLNLVVASGVTTVTGNLVVAMPRHLARYTLRPYAVAGGGLMNTHLDYALNVLQVVRNMGTFDVGGGVTGFVTDKIGVSWDIRHFRSVGGRNEGFSFGAEELSFWRAHMALAIRY